MIGGLLGIRRHHKVSVPVHPSRNRRVVSSLGGGAGPNCSYLKHVHNLTRLHNLRGKVTVDVITRWLLFGVWGWSLGIFQCPRVFESCFIWELSGENFLSGCECWLSGWENTNKVKAPVFTAIFGLVGPWVLLL